MPFNYNQNFIAKVKDRSTSRHNFYSGMNVLNIRDFDFTQKSTNGEFEIFNHLPIQHIYDAWEAARDINCDEDDMGPVWKTNVEFFERVLFTFPITCIQRWWRKQRLEKRKVLNEMVLEFHDRPPHLTQPLLKHGGKGFQQSMQNIFDLVK